VVYKMNPPHRNVSVLLSVLLVVAALAAIIVGFVMRKKFFRLSTEALAGQMLVEFPDVAMLEFKRAFGCHEGQKMVRENFCRIW